MVVKHKYKTCMSLVLGRYLVNLESTKTEILNDLFLDFGMIDQNVLNKLNIFYDVVFGHTFQIEVSSSFNPCIKIIVNFRELFFWYISKTITSQNTTPIGRHF